MSACAAPKPPARSDDRSSEERVTSLLPLAKRLARRYRHAGESQEDLEQVAYLGLVEAVNRYDPSVGPLVRYAVPTILGELRRHFRDKGWGVHVPRSVQENLMTVNRSTERLATVLGRTPTAGDIADAANMSVEDVVEALDAGRSYSPAPLDAPRASDDLESPSLGDGLGSTDPNYELVELGAAIGPAFRELSSREQTIVQLRVFEDLTQSEIAEHVGVSQMHVSRLLRRALDSLRGAATDAAA